MENLALIHKLGKAARCKNILCFYTLITESNSIYNYVKKNRISKDKFIQGHKRCILKALRHWWKKQKIINKWKNISHSWIGRTNIVKMSILPNLQVQWNPSQNFNGSIHRNIMNNLKFVWNHKKTPSSQSNLKKEQQSWKHHTSWFQTILQSYSNQNTMVLTLRQTHRSTEQNPEPRNKPTHIWSICDKRVKNIKWGKGWSLQ